MVCLLLQRGASIEAKTRKGFRPLHVAALCGHEEVVRLLLEKDDNPDAETQRFGINDEAQDDGDGMTEGFTDEDGIGINDVILGVVLCLEKRMHQRLAKEGKEMTTPRSWTAQQLAAKSGSRAMQKPLAL